MGTAPMRNIQGVSGKCYSTPHGTPKWWRNSRQSCNRGSIRPTMARCLGRLWPWRWSVGWRLGISFNPSLPRTLYAMSLGWDPIYQCILNQLQHNHNTSKIENGTIPSIMMQRGCFGCTTRMCMECLTTMQHWDKILKYWQPTTSDACVSLKQI
jgi:hypothetical protein